MKIFFRPSNILFYFLSSVMFFFLGMIFAGITNAGKDQGLAAGAIVFGYGVIAGFVTFLSSIVAARILKEQYIVLINKIFAVVIILLLTFFVYRFLTHKAAADESQGVKLEKKIDLTFASVFQLMPSGEKEIPFGLGMSKPRFYENNAVYFYGDPNLEKSVSDHAPMDSLVFRRTEIGIELSYAPPWFAPAHLKMDYEILFLRIITLHREFIGVIVNELDGRIAFMNRYDSDLQYWPEFLLSVSSVEPINVKTNPIRARPFLHASISPIQYSILKPIRISDKWIEVELYDDNLKSHGKGWLQWQENGKLLITYSLLS